MKTYFIFKAVILGAVVSSSSAAATKYNEEAVCFASPESPPQPGKEEGIMACALPHPSKLPAVLIVGETHEYSLDLPKVDEESAQAARIAQEFWKLTRKQALKGELLIAAESLPAALDGRSFTATDYRDLFELGFVQMPMEGELPLALAGLIHHSLSPLYEAFARTDADYHKYQEDRRDNQLVNFAFNSYLQAAWKKLPRPFAEPTLEAVAKKLDALACAKNPRKMVLNYRETMSPEERGALFPLFETIYPALGEYYEVQAENKDRARQLRKLIDEKTYLRDALGFQKSFMPLVNEIREEKMLENLGRMYCALAPKGLNIYVNTGNAHATPLFEKLSQVFSGRGLNPALVKIFDLRSSSR